MDPILFKGMSLMAEQLYLQDTKLHKCIVVGEIKKDDELNFTITNNYERGKIIAAKLSKKHKQSFVAFCFKNYPNIKWGRADYVDPKNN